MAAVPTHPPLTFDVLVHIVHFVIYDIDDAGYNERQAERERLQTVRRLAKVFPDLAQEKWLWRRVSSLGRLRELFTELSLDAMPTVGEVCWI